MLCRDGEPPLLTDFEYSSSDWFCARRRWNGLNASLSFNLTESGTGREYWKACIRDRDVYLGDYLWYARYEKMEDALAALESRWLDFVNGRAFDPGERHSSLFD